MMTAQGKVIGYEKGRLIVSCQQKSSCQSCAAKSQCGTGMVVSALPSRELALKVMSDVNIATGTEVLIGCPEHTLWRFASILYLIPLFFLLIGALMGEQVAAYFSLSEGVVIFSALGLMMLGIASAKCLSQWLEKKMHPNPLLLKTLP